jgi:hypothetical protein
MRSRGFAFAMQCKGTKTVLTYRFGQDMVSGTIDTLIVNAPKYSSSILTVMRRVWECQGQEKPARGALTSETRRTASAESAR